MHRRCPGQLMPTRAVVFASEGVTKGRVVSSPSGLPSLGPGRHLVPAVCPPPASTYLEVWVPSPNLPPHILL